MRRHTIRLVVILGAISIVGIISVQTYFLIKAWNIREKELNQSIVISLKTVAEKICRLNQTVPPAGNPVRQLSSNYFVVDINSPIDVNVLEHYLKSTFEQMNIKTDYEYAIYDCHTDRMVYGNYISASGSGEKIKSGNTLPKYSEYLYYFGIRFPALRRTVAGDITILFFFTSILIISVIFFVYAILVILRQKRLSEMQKDFINNMTHEFKTPISTVNISADVITNPGILKDPERLFKYGSIIKQENMRLDLLVAEVLQIAHIEKNGFRLKKEAIDLNEFVRTVAGTFREQIRPGGVVEVTTDPEAITIYADIIHITNIFHNLFENAIKFGPENPEIRISTYRKTSSNIWNGIFRNGEKAVCIVFSDNGPGIDPKYRKRIFQKFFRIPSGNVHDVKGFGLGLYYVRNICQVHGWKISLNPDSGRGASFIIEIPEQ
ncbi:MAG: HAMP domain-containing sensor histidine kinase [Bacteroidota bacterium]|nr:HAMP domain-containing sensor histidine kinase [Bacteroidota bacterium]